MRVHPLVPYYPEKLIDPNRAAEMVGVTRTTLAAWRCNKRYRLPFVKVGRVIRYYESDVLAFLRDHTIGRESRG